MDEKFETDELGNAAISELCAREAERVSGHLRQAFRRAARKALLWAEEARDLVIAGRSLSELNGIGPFLARQIRKWIDESLDVIDRPPIRQEFLTLTEARRVLSRFSKRQAMVRGDLHMRTVWSDGSAAVAEMACAALERGYNYVAITDHTKGLRIASGLDERQLIQQRHEIDATNQKLLDSGVSFMILRSAEVNLSPFGEPDISPDALSELDLVWVHSIRRFVVPKIKLSVIWRHCATKTSIFSLILKAEFSIIERVCVQIGIVSLLRLRGLIKPSRLMAMPIARISD